MLEFSAVTARRLAIACQRLDGNADMLDVLRALGCVQLDPISAVERSHLLVLFSRLGNYDRADFERLLWEERQVFEYWAHEASIVLTEDYPIHAYRMATYPNGERGGHWLSAWIDENRQMFDSVRGHLIERLEEEGPLPSRMFDDERTGGHSSGWTSGRVVNRVLDYLWQRGEALVAGRNGQTRLWDVAGRVLPERSPQEALPEREVTRRAAQKALRALGMATPMQIKQHFIRRRYPELDDVLAELEQAGRVHRVKIRAGDGNNWKGKWYIHADDLPLAERIERGEWQPERAALLSPFDNLICDRKRTEQVFDFSYTIEIYTPKEKRQYGYYVMPALYGDRFIGRIDLKMDRQSSRLIIHSVHAEPGAPVNPQTAAALRTEIESLADWLGAETIDYAGAIPPGWEKLRQ
jgi:uncharacterized protein